MTDANRECAVHCGSIRCETYGCQQPPESDLWTGHRVEDLLDDACFYDFGEGDPDAIADALNRRGVVFAPRVLPPVDNDGIPL